MVIFTEKIIAIKSHLDENGARGEAFESYSLINSQETLAVDIEVYDGGDTEVMLTLYRPLSDIREYWPAS